MSFVTDPSGVTEEQANNRREKIQDEDTEFSSFNNNVVGADIMNFFELTNSHTSWNSKIYDRAMFLC
jgi:hypothetical protein